MPYDPAGRPVAAPAPRHQAGGFGGAVASRMLEHSPLRKSPWLTVEAAEQELAIGEYARDRAAVALDSVR